MRQQASDRPRRIHPRVDGMVAELRGSRVDRREFVRTVTLLGLSSSAAYTLAGKVLGECFVDPADAATGKPERGGGVLRVSMPLPEISDPATYDWIVKSNVSRHVVEYLTITGADNVTRPYLVERWEPSDDLRTWTFHLRRGIKWHNGDDFTVEDVEFNFRRWLDPRTGSSNQALFAGMLEEVQTGESNPDGTRKITKRMRENAFERVDDYTFRLHLSRPALAIPENLYNYPTAILHRSFDDRGGNLAKQPIGTGPYTLTEFAAGERAVLRRTEQPYWGGEIRLDEIRYVDYGPASPTQLAAFASGQVDMVHEFDIASLNMAEAIPHGVVYETKTAATSCVRMRVTEAPFDNRKVRQAILACVDADKYPGLVFQGRSQVGEHHHVAPIHPSPLCPHGRLVGRYLRPRSFIALLVRLPSRYQPSLAAPRPPAARAHCPAIPCTKSALALAKSPEAVLLTRQRIHMWARAHASGRRRQPEGRSGQDYARHTPGLRGPDCRVRRPDRGY
jgi:peptide/nickel transport system substrate-binding protein